MPIFKSIIDGAEYEVEANSQQEADAYARQAHGKGMDVGTTLELDDIVVTPESNPDVEEVQIETVQTDKPEPSMLQKIGDVFTGNLRATPETEALGDWASMPELNELSLNSFQAALGTMLSSPEETAGIIKAQYPNVQMRTDYNGNIILKSSIDGKEYAIKPGFQLSDVPRTAGALAAFTPAGAPIRAEGFAAGALSKLPGVSAQGAAKALNTSLGIGVRSGATQAAIEGVEAGTGGEFNSGNVAAATAIPAAIPLASRLMQSVKSKLFGAPNPAAEAVAGAVDNVPVAAPQAATVEPATLEEISVTAKKAGEGGKSAFQELATQAMPDQQKIEAAKRLGIEEYLQPDHVTTNQVFRELSQAVKSYPGSLARAQELEGMAQITKRVDDMLANIGANDASVVSDMAKRDLEQVYEKSYKEAGKLYEEIRTAIPPTTPVNADNVLTTIRTRAEELGGVENLSAPERMILSKLSPKEGKQPTYALLDDVRRDIVAAKYKNQGAFKDSDDRLLDIMNNALRSDQQAVVEQFGLGDKFNLAQSTAATYKAIQDDLTSLFGKSLSGSIVGDISASTRSLAKGDTSKFINLLGAIKYLPKDQQQQIVATGLATAFGKKLRNENMNFGAYADWYRGLKSNQKAYTALMSNLPKGTAKNLDDLYKVSDGISKAALERIGTGRINVVNDIVKNADTAIGRMYDSLKTTTQGATIGAIGGMLGPLGGGLSGALASALSKKKEPAMQAVDRVISSPQFIKAATNPTPENVRKLAYDQRFIEFMKYVNKNADLSDRERFILSTIQAEKPKD